MVMKYQIILSLKCEVYVAYWVCIFGSHPVGISEVEHSRKEGL